MVCQGIEVFNNMTSIDVGTIMAFPTYCDYYFWFKILAGFWFILSLIVYQKERETLVRPDFISCAGVSSLATILVALILSLLNAIQGDVFIMVVVSASIPLIIWFFKR